MIGQRHPRWRQESLPVFSNEPLVEVTPLVGKGRVLALDNIDGILTAQDGVEGVCSVKGGKNRAVKPLQNN